MLFLTTMPSSVSSTPSTSMPAIAAACPCPLSTFLVVARGRPIEKYEIMSAASGSSPRLCATPNLSQLLFPPVFPWLDFRWCVSGPGGGDSDDTAGERASFFGRRQGYWGEVWCGTPLVEFVGDDLSISAKYHAYTLLFLPLSSLHIMLITAHEIPARRSVRPPSHACLFRRAEGTQHTRARRGSPTVVPFHP